MNYHSIVHFAQSWGLFFLVVPFCIALVYALWPSNKALFDRAARAPLETGDE